MEGIFLIQTTGLSIVLTIGRPLPIPKQELYTPLGVYLRTVSPPPSIVKMIERPVIQTNEKVSEGRLTILNMQPLYTQMQWDVLL